MTRLAPFPLASRARTGLWISASVLCAAPSASAQESFLECTRVHHTLTRSVPEDGYAQALASVPDVDGDGLGELLVGSPGTLGFHEPGRVQLFDGRSGLERWRVDGARDDRLGHAVAAAGDLDGDGRGDVLVGAPGLGAARVYSGVDGALLLELAGQAGGFGVSVAGVGDVDLDGVPDLAVGEASGSVVVPVRGRVSLVSGLDGHELLSLSGLGANDHFGDELARLDDVDHDGRAELAVLSRSAWDAGRGPGRVSVFALATGEELFSRTPEQRRSYQHIAALGNVNVRPFTTPGLLITGGVDDLAGPQPVDLDDRGLAQVLRADTGELVRELTGRFQEFFGPASGVEDVDRDGRADFVTTGFGPELDPNGWLGVFSTRTGELLRKVSLTGPYSSFQDVVLGPDLDGDQLGELVASTNTATGSQVFVISSVAPALGLGSGAVGSGWVEPQISLGGCPRLARSMRVETERVVGGALGALVLGLSRVDRPFHGATLYPSHDLTFVHTASGAPGVSGAGDASLALDLPSDTGLTGLSFYVQAAYLDRGAPNGVSLTRALQLSLY